MRIGPRLVSVAAVGAIREYQSTTQTLHDETLRQGHRGSVTLANVLAPIAFPGLPRGILSDPPRKQQPYTPAIRGATSHGARSAGAIGAQQPE